MPHLIAVSARGDDVVLSVLTAVAACEQVLRGALLGLGLVERDAIHARKVSDM